VGREVWGTYSVRDHLEEHPWAADVLLYDRLVIPVPPVPGDPRDPAEWARWQDNGWRPEWQRELLAVLGERASPVTWTPLLRDQWSSLHVDARAGLAQGVGAEAQRPSAANPYLATAMVLERRLPSRVTAVTAVATYRSLADLEAAVALRELTPVDPLPAGQLTVVIGREFLVPDADDFSDDLDLLKAALDIEDDDVRRRRAAYWRWQREFLRDGMFVDQDSIAAAAEEMQDLVADEQRAVRRSRTRLVTLFALTTATAAAALLSGPLIPLTLTAAFLSVGQFVASEAFDAREPSQPSPAGLLITARKELGWR
jgi:hypothetical protein